MRPDWTVRKAIEDQVRKEDQYAWAMRPTEEFKVIPPMPAQTWKRAPIRAFISSILP